MPSPSDENKIRVDASAGVGVTDVHFQYDSGTDQAPAAPAYEQQSADIGIGWDRASSSLDLVVGGFGGITRFSATRAQTPSEVKTAYGLRWGAFGSAHYKLGTQIALGAAAKVGGMTMRGTQDVGGPAAWSWESETFYVAAFELTSRFYFSGNSIDVGWSVQAPLNAVRVPSPQASEPAGSISTDFSQGPVVRFARKF